MAHPFLYDLKLRNLTRQQMGDAMYILSRNEKVFQSDRAISIEVDQDEKNRHLWQIMIYHLKPKMFALALTLLMDKEVYPILGDFKT